MKILCLLVTCFNPTNARCSRNQVREKQFVDGITKFLEYKHILDQHDVKICLVDNSCDTMPSYISNLLPNDVIINVQNNNKGERNKGVGLIWQWKQCQDIIKEYDYIIHFEPRQIMVNFNFINSFLSRPRTLLNINNRNHMINTGLLCIDSNSLIKYIDNADTTMMNEKSICIEGDLMKFIDRERIGYDTEESLNIIWHDGINPVNM